MIPFQGAQKVGVQVRSEARLPIYLATELPGKIQDVQLCLAFRQTMGNFFHY